MRDEAALGVGNRCSQTWNVRTAYGAYSIRRRRELVEARAVLAAGEDASSAPSPDGAPLLPPGVVFEDAPSPAPRGSAEARRRQAWARMLRKVFEVDPLVCPRCGVEMEIVAWITEPRVVDAILKHRREHGLVSPFEARAPPAA